MRGVISWGRRNGWHGLEHIKVHTPNSSTRAVQEYLTRDEATRLVDACVELHQRLFVRLALATGARMSAVLELKWSDITWPVGHREPATNGRALIAVNERPCPFTETIFDLRMKEAMRINMGQGRGNKRRGTGVIGPSNVALYIDLKEAHDNRKSDYVIEHKGKPLKTISLKAAYERAGLGHFKRQQHLLKHTCCSWLVQDGQSFESVAKLVGTRAAVIETHYGHLSPQHMATVGDTLSV